MKIAQDGIWLCSDCTQVACNGPRGIELLNETATMEGLAKLGPHLVPDFDSETSEGILQFSNRMCDACGTYHAGYRSQFAILE